MGSVITAILIVLIAIAASGQEISGTSGGHTATTIEGRVISVTNGNTFILSTGDEKYRVRVIGIEVPWQSLKDQSRDSLSRLIKGKDVKVIARPINASRGYGDFYVGKAFVANQDIGIEQIWSGLAWTSEDFAEQQNPADRRAYAEAEDKAREAQLGLWSGKHKECKVKSESTGGLPQSAAAQAKAAHKVSGVVILDIMIDETGKVAEATARCGHPILQTAALKDLQRKRFEPTNVSGQAVKVSGSLTYNFVLEESDVKKNSAH
jgi:TonB family protein